MIFSGRVAFDIRREISSRKDIHRSLRERFSGNSQLHSRARDVRDCTLIRAGLTLLGRGEVVRQQTCTSIVGGRGQICL